MRPTLHFILFVLLLLSCGTDDNDVTRNPKSKSENKLLEFSKINDVTLAELENSFGFVFAGTAGVANKEDLTSVSAYKITYKTQHPYFNGFTIAASGLVVVPNVNEKLPIISYQHGTITDKDQVPSSFVDFSETRDYLSVLSGLQNIVIASDYLGYGESSEILHPYEHGPSLALSTYDMLVAAKEFLDQQSIAYNDKLFLTGYSEGGYASMALHQHIEQNTEIEVTLSILGGGAYNKSLFAKEIMQKNEPLEFIPNYLWVLFTYNNIYNINEPLSFYINDEYLTEDIDPNNFLNLDNISTNPQELFTENFRNIILNNESHPMLDALKDNDRFDWNPKADVYLIHGEDDDFVYPSNATTAYEAMRTDENDDNINLVILSSPSNHFETAAAFALSIPILINDYK